MIRKTKHCLANPLYASQQLDVCSGINSEIQSLRNDIKSSSIAQARRLHGSIRSDISSKATNSVSSSPPRLNLTPIVPIADQVKESPDILYHGTVCETQPTNEKTIKTPFNKRLISSTPDRNKLIKRVLNHQPDIRVLQNTGHGEDYKLKPKVKLNCKSKGYHNPAVYTGKIAKNHSKVNIEGGKKPQKNVKYQNKINKDLMKGCDIKDNKNSQPRKESYLKGLLQTVLENVPVNKINEQITDDVSKGRIPNDACDKENFIVTLKCDGTRVCNEVTSKSDHQTLIAISQQGENNYGVVLKEDFSTSYIYDHTKSPERKSEPKQTHYQFGDKNVIVDEYSSFPSPKPHMGVKPVTLQGCKDTVISLDNLQNSQNLVSLPKSNVFCKTTEGGDRTHLGSRDIILPIDHCSQSNDIRAVGTNDMSIGLRAIEGVATTGLPEQNYCHVVGNKEAFKPPTEVQETENTEINYPDMEDKGIQTTTTQICQNDDCKNIPKNNEMQKMYINSHSLHNSKNGAGFQTQNISYNIPDMSTENFDTVPTLKNYDFPPSYNKQCMLGNLTSNPVGMIANHNVLFDKELNAMVRLTPTSNNRRLKLHPEDDTSFIFTEYSGNYSIPIAIQDEKKQDVLYQHVTPTCVTNNNKTIFNHMDWRDELSSETSLQHQLAHEQQVSCKLKAENRDLHAELDYMKESRHKLLLSLTDKDTCIAQQHQDKLQAAIQSNNAIDSVQHRLDVLTLEKEAIERENHILAISLKERDGEIQKLQEYFENVKNRVSDVVHNMQSYTPTDVNDCKSRISTIYLPLLQGLFREGPDLDRSPCPNISENISSISKQKDFKYTLTKENIALHQSVPALPNLHILQTHPVISESDKCFNNDVYKITNTESHSLRFLEMVDSTKAKMKYNDVSANSLEDSITSDELNVICDNIPVGFSVDSSESESFKGQHTSQAVCTVKRLKFPPSEESGKLETYDSKKAVDNTLLNNKVLPLDGGARMDTFMPDSALKELPLELECLSVEAARTDKHGDTVPTSLTHAPLNSLCLSRDSNAKINKVTNIETAADDRSTFSQMTISTLKTVDGENFQKDLALFDQNVLQFQHRLEKSKTSLKL